MSTPRHSFPRWLWVTAGCGVLTLVLGVAVVAVGWFALGQLGSFDFLGSTLVDKLTPAQIEQAAAIKLPPSARAIHSTYESFQDYNLHVRFEMDAADLPAFTAQLPITQPLTSTMPNSIVSTINQVWWQPTSATTFQAVEESVNLPNGPQSIALLIDTTNPTTYIVYVAAFST